jgi:hypothetical protein
MVPNFVNHYPNHNNLKFVQWMSHCSIISWEFTPVLSVQIHLWDGTLLLHPLGSDTTFTNNIGAHHFISIYHSLTFSFDVLHDLHLQFIQILVCCWPIWFSDILICYVIYISICCLLRRITVFCIHRLLVFLYFPWLQDLHHHSQHYQWWSNILCHHWENVPVTYVYCSVRYIHIVAIISFTPMIIIAYVHITLQSQWYIDVLNKLQWLVLPMIIKDNN